MKQFMDEDFLLSNETAKTLYHEYAEKLPIIDYHCHINPKEIAENKSFENITEVWLGGDHYKWRAIRSNGTPEELITGDATAREKFEEWAKTLPKAIGNPLYHWTHLELKRYFGYDKALTPKTSEEVWNLCNKKLTAGNMTARDIMQSSNVKVICTTDDPIDSLEYHIAIKNDTSFDIQVLPTFRPDKAVNIEKAGFVEYIAKLAEVANMEIKTVADLFSALTKRIGFFHEVGCRVSDHGLDYVPYIAATPEEVEAIFQKGLAGESVTAQETDKYKTALLEFFGKQYAKNNWVMQLHFGVIRNINHSKFNKLGADTGFDAIGTYPCADNLANFLNSLNITDELPKTIIYSINPGDNASIGTIMGAFQGPEAKSKIQHGSGWWFNDTKTGMIEQMTSLGNLGLLGNFVGMLTDSRSFLSYTRHEYFRRILCNLIGTWVENGEYPNDIEMLGQLVSDICYYNTVNYFGFNVK